MLPKKLWTKQDMNVTFMNLCKIKKCSILYYNLDMGINTVHYTISIIFYYFSFLFNKLIHLFHIYSAPDCSFFNSLLSGWRPEVRGSCLVNPSLKCSHLSLQTNEHVSFPRSTPSRSVPSPHCAERSNRPWRFIQHETNLFQMNWRDSWEQR